MSRPDIKPATPCQALGYTFRPVTDETIRLLTLAGAPVIQMIPLLKKYFPRLAVARSKMKRAFILTQMRVEVAAKIRETRDDSIITAFILVSDPADCARFLNRSREGALMAARYHFIHLLDKQLNQLARAAGNYFAEQIIAKLILDGGHE